MSDTLQPLLEVNGSIAELPTLADLVSQDLLQNHTPASIAETYIRLRAVSERYIEPLRRAIEAKAAEHFAALKELGESTECLDVKVVVKGGKASFELPENWEEFPELCGPVIDRNTALANEQLVKAEMDKELDAIKAKYKIQLDAAKKTTAAAEARIQVALTGNPNANVTTSPYSLAIQFPVL